MRVLRDAGYSEETTQEIYLEVWRTASEYDTAKGFRPRLADDHGPPAGAIDSPHECGIRAVRSASARRRTHRAPQRHPPARRATPLGGRYDTAANLRRTLDAVEALGHPAGRVVFTGDLTDLGEPEAYSALRAAVEPVAARLGAPVIWVAGNHDERPALRRELLGGRAEPRAGDRGLRPRRAPADRPGHDACPAGTTATSTTRSWTGCAMCSPAAAPLGTILAMHHPPLPSHIPFFDILELRDQAAARPTSSPAPTCARSSRATCTIRRAAHSRASP